jgi:hypothetical protein
MQNSVRVLCLGLAQLIFWGSTYYSIGIFGPHFEARLGLDKEFVYGGFSAALVAMAFVSAHAGSLMQRFGGFRVLAAGAVLAAGSLVSLSVVSTIWAYYGAWVTLGIAMRLMLYDAAFSALALIDGAKASRGMAQITLLGGLASTVFWPLGHSMISWFGVETALRIYAGLALAGIVFLLPLRGARPAERVDMGQGGARKAAGLIGDSPAILVPFSVIVTGSVFLLAGVSSQLIPILVDLGNAPETAAFAAAFMGIGIITSRVVQVFLGHLIDAARLNVISGALIVFGFSLGWFAGREVFIGVAVAFFYGAGHGLTAIVRGTLALLLFDQESYAERLGRLIVPGFFFSAAAPTVYAFLMDEFGGRGAIAFSWSLGAIMVAAAVLLRYRLRADAVVT